MRSPRFVGVLVGLVAMAAGGAAGLELIRGTHIHRSAAAQGHVQPAPVGGQWAAATSAAGAGTAGAARDAEAAESVGRRLAAAISATEAVRDRLSDGPTGSLPLPSPAQRADLALLMVQAWCGRSSGTPMGPWGQAAAPQAGSQGEALARAATAQELVRVECERWLARTQAGTLRDTLAAVADDASSAEQALRELIAEP